MTNKPSWQTELQDWIKNQHGSAGWEQKLEAFIQDLLDRKARQIKAFKIDKPQKDNGLTYPVGALHKAYNEGLDDALSILKEE